MFEYTPKDIELTKKIILNITSKRMVVDSIELDEIAKKILSIVSSIGGGFTEMTIRSVAEIKIKEWYQLG